MTTYNNTTNLDPQQLIALKDVWSLILPHSSFAPLSQLTDKHNHSLWPHSLHKSFWFHLSNNKHIYMYGPVGRGKTTIMQIVYDAYNGPKRRLHFDQFSAELHHALNTMDVQHYVTKMFPNHMLIWIDELQIYDIATAMLLKKMIPEIIKQKHNILMTGNTAPIDFYKGGLNRDQFEGFIPYFFEHFSCIELKGDVDYRYQALSHTFKTQHLWIRSEISFGDIENAFLKSAPAEYPIPFTLQLNMREWKLKKTLANAAMLTFEELAEENHCSDDYSALIKKFPNIFITNVPIFTTNNMESCRRFIAFIDIAYDQGAKIFIESQTDPELLYQDPLKRLPFQRTQSRLKEMLET